MSRLFILTTMLLITAPIAAFAFIAENGLIVRQNSPTSFEVPYRGLSGARDFWCAAGDFVRNELKRPADTRIYRVSPVPRRSGEGIQFSLSPEGAQPTGLAVVGDLRSISASHARLLCPERWEKF